MQSKIDKIRSICRMTENYVSDAFPDLQLCYIVHGTGQFVEAVALKEQDIITHPSSESAQIIIKKFLSQEQTSFLGLSIARTSRFFGLFQRDSILGLININADHYNDIDEAKHDIAHLAWHAIDLMEVRKNPKYKGKLKTGPMIPKRSPYNLSKANMKADIFASTLISQMDKENGVPELSKRRAMNALSASRQSPADEYPFVVAKEPSEFAVTDLLQVSTGKQGYLKAAQKTAAEIAQIVDESGIGIEQWWSFTNPAQDMAWRGYQPDVILGAAMNTSEDPYVRAIGYLIVEITGLKPKSTIELMNSYNAFSDSDYNAKVHRNMVEGVFEDLLETSMRQKNSEIMILTANQQNENMTSGNLIGWCASTLQASARAFEKALKMEQEPERAARIEFEGNVEHTKWETLETLSDKIVDRKRLGYVVTMGHIAELCEELEGVNEVFGSVQKTIQDPSYVQKLDNVRELEKMPKMEVNGPAPVSLAAAPRAMPAAPAPAGPGMGMGGTSRAAIRRQTLQNHKIETETDGKSS